jgi:hypothetical protein
MPVRRSAAHRNEQRTVESFVGQSRVTGHSVWKLAVGTVSNTKPGSLPWALASHTWRMFRCCDLKQHSVVLSGINVNNLRSSNVQCYMEMKSSDDKAEIGLVQRLLPTTGGTGPDRDLTACHSRKAPHVQSPPFCSIQVLSEAVTSVHKCERGIVITSGRLGACGASWLDYSSPPFPFSLRSQTRPARAIGFKVWPTA